MKAPPLKKGTRAAVEVVPLLGMDGAALAVVLVKQRYHVNRRQMVHAVDGAEVHPVDVPWDPKRPATSSIRFPADVCLDKPGTDVIVAGSAASAHGEPQTSLDVAVRVGELRQAVRVFGPRVWFRSVGETRLSEPAPFRAVPIQWELAWGGADFSDPAAPLEEARNPVGRGLVRDPAALIDQPGPQVEFADDPIRTPRDRPVPAGLGAIGRHWLPRRRYTGTIDERWLRERMPLLPTDFDPRFHHAAAPGLVSTMHLRGAEPVEVTNLGAPLRFELPRAHYFVGLQTRDRMREFPPVLDTVLLQPGERWVDLTWRSVVPLPRMTEVEFVQVHEKARVGGG